MILHQEHFEAWLFSQPDDRQWNYGDTTGCVVCSFVKETTNHIPTASNKLVRLWKGEPYRNQQGEFQLPAWLYDFLGNALTSNIGNHLVLGDYEILKAPDLKQIYHDLFHEKNEAETSQPVHSPAPLVPQP